MVPEAKAFWSALEFRRPMMLRQVEPLSEEQMLWVPGPGRVSIAWQLWHIAEVEDLWIRELVLDKTLEFPFGVPVRDADASQYPKKLDLLRYFHKSRFLSQSRLEDISAPDFDRMVEDVNFGRIQVRDVWSGVATSFSWHAGQIALTAKLIPDTPVKTQSMKFWKRPK